MAIQSLRVTKKELQTYYTPKVSDYEKMVDSINSTMGYGQIIQAYNGTMVTNTYYHVYDTNFGGEIVMDKTSGSFISAVEAGPYFWGVSSITGIEFLNGTTDIPGLRKLKYCDGCSDGNGLDKPVVDNFSKRFRKVSELVLAYNLLEGFLFYDDSLPKYSDVFPAIKRDDGINITYQFKDVNSGADLSVEQVSLITDTPVVAIEASITTAPVVKPQEGANTVITSCCDESVSYVILGQYTIGNILYTDSVRESYCWFVESLTNNDPTLPASFTFTPFERSCEACIGLNPCPTSDTSSSVVPCCPGGERGIINGVYPIDTVVYTKDTDPPTCFVVTGNNSDIPTLPYMFEVYGGDCAQCTGGCGGFVPGDFTFTDGNPLYTTNTVTFTKTGTICLEGVWINGGSLIGINGGYNTSGEVWSINWYNTTSNALLNRQTIPYAGASGYLSKNSIYGESSCYAVIDVTLGSTLKFQFLRGGRPNETALGVLNIYNSSFSGTLVDTITATQVSACYLTTTMVQYKGLLDDGPELIAMRQLRDHYMGDEYYDNGLIEYYANSQAIIDGINASVDPSIDYEFIYQSVLKVKNYVDQSMWKEAIDEYIDTYFILKNKYI